MEVALLSLTMRVNGSSASASVLAPYSGTARYCPHNGAREIRMYLPYADANTVRLRFILTGDPRWRHVSAIYEVPHGWGWTICNECPAHAGREAVGE
jgi:hypothetical protein